MSGHGGHTLLNLFCLTTRVKNHIPSGFLPPFPDSVTSKLFKTNFTFWHWKQEHLTSVTYYENTFPRRQRTQAEIPYDDIFSFSTYKLQNVFKPTRPCIYWVLQSQNLLDLMCGIHCIQYMLDSEHICSKLIPVL